MGASLAVQPAVANVGGQGAAGHRAEGRGLSCPLPSPQAGFLSGAFPDRFAGLASAVGGVASGLLTSLALRWPSGAGQVGHSSAGCWSLDGSSQPLPGSSQDGATAPGGLAGAPEARSGTVLQASEAGVLW